MYAIGFSCDSLLSFVLKSLIAKILVIQFTCQESELHSSSTVISMALTCLIFLLILHAASFSESTLLQCKGHFSTLTYADCQTVTYFSSRGCFFLEGFLQYRSCSSVCNSVKSGSRSEAKCKEFCGGRCFCYSAFYSVSRTAVFSRYKPLFQLRSQLLYKLSVIVPGAKAL